MLPAFALYKALCCEINKIMRVFRLLYSLFFFLSCWLHVAHAQPVPVRIDVKAKHVYLPGLPVIVEVTITNISNQTIETLKPVKEMYALGAMVKREGEAEPLRPTRHITHVVGEVRTVRLKPGDKATARLDLNTMFQDALPVGRYLCTINYLFGKEHYKVQNARALPVIIDIQEPYDAVVEMQRDMRREAIKFRSAQMYHVDHTEHGLKIARQIFSELAQAAAHPEYRKVSAYYLALLAKEPRAKLAAYLNYLKNPTTDLPDATGMDDINRCLGYLYFETGDLGAAREAFLKLPDRDSATRNMIEKVETDLKAGS